MDKLLWLLFCCGLISSGHSKSKGGLYSFNVRNLNNELTSLESYRGKVTLVVNVASECGYTDEHYKEMVALYDELAIENNEPFTILAFPCNQFGNQEPYENHAIANHVKSQYGVKFPLFGKTKVVGHEVDPVFSYLSKSSNGHEPTWNFWKYLVNEEGQVIGNWGPRVSVMDLKGDIIAALERLKMQRIEL